MTPEQLTQLIAAPEDARLERKPEGVNRSEIRQTLVAFANSVQVRQEAVLFVGIHDSGEVQGVANPEAIQNLVRAVCAQDCYPPIEVQTVILLAGDKRILAAVVGHSTQKPHFSGPAFVRVGNASVAATPAQYEALIASRHEKCGVIQGWTMPITIREEGYRLQTMRAVPAWVAVRLCTIVSCNAHNVTFQDTASGNNFTVPLSRVDISYDQEHHRNQLTIHA